MTDVDAELAELGADDLSPMENDDIGDELAEIEDDRPRSKTSAKNKADDDSEDESESENDTIPPDDPEVNEMMRTLAEGSPDDMPKKKSNRWPKVVDVLRGYGHEASAHGVGHMAEAHTFKVLCFWVTMMTVCIAGIIYLSLTTWLRYTKYETLVSTRTGLDVLPFPAVSICNINPYKQSEVKKVDQLSALITIYNYATQKQSDELV